jgi:23S rRNA (uracil1939-C5)-methyltransferase
MPTPVSTSKFQLKIDSLAPGGDGVGRLADGRAVFVPYAAAGDTVEAMLSEEHKTYARAKILRILEAGPARVTPPCPVAGRCGGCAWQHIDYKAQAEAKAGFIRESLRRIGGFVEPPVTGVLAAADPLRYRNKGQVPVSLAPDGTLRMGYYREGSHDVVALPDEGCRLLVPAVDQALLYVRAQLPNLGLQPYDQKTGEGTLRHVMVRANSAGQAMAVLVTRTPLTVEQNAMAAAWLGQAGIISVQNNLQGSSGNVILGNQTLLLAGEADLIEQMDGLKFRLSATSFFQVNTVQATALVGVLKSIRPWAPGEHVLEIYCGVGTLSLPLGKLGLRLRGVENHAAAVEDARANAVLNSIQGVSFTVAEAIRAFDGLPPDFKPQVLLMDPPRKGMDQGIFKALEKHPVPEIVYVSCDPPSLSRDLKTLAAAGWSLKRTQGVDLFPQTPHVESVSWLVRA